jgi:hypothetical protein
MNSGTRMQLRSLLHTGCNDITNEKQTELYFRVIYTMLRIDIKNIVELKNNPDNVFKLGLTLKCAGTKLDYVQITSHYPLQFYIVNREKNVIREKLISLGVPSNKIN